MRSIYEVEHVLELLAQGHNQSKIARRTGIPRQTIVTWANGRIPRARLWGPDGLRLCEQCGHREHDFAKLPGATYAYVLGLYLGDGCIVQMPKRVFRLGISLDSRYPLVIEECAAAIGLLMPDNVVRIQRKRNENWAEVLCYSRKWPCLIPQHGSGLKHEREIRFVDWQQAIVDKYPRALLRGLIFSDGSRSINTIKRPNKTYRYWRYQFSNRSEDIKRIFCHSCDRLGIEWRVMNSMTISVARRESIERMDRFIGPKR